MVFASNEDSDTRRYNEAPYLWFIDHIYHTCDRSMVIDTLSICDWKILVHKYFLVIEKLQILKSDGPQALKK